MSERTAGISEKSMRPLILSSLPNSEGQYHCELGNKTSSTSGHVVRRASHHFWSSAKATARSRYFGMSVESRATPGSA